MQLDDGRAIELVKGFAELAQARYVEHAFELHLGIEDRPVATEVRSRKDREVGYARAIRPRTHRPMADD